eukprot:CAMPEP_0170261262 /NCGR_PEP_ID=MMETSP0116_2-20130129/30511_1 /TAXON_ID=400756 /ORGANISM="Durinskia baltica, Strain CSIRO CS-38" /LENGTH=791 /DNA_ID=CAMNT_0010512325 /DNA_START=33 /DNA_END=2407 /DNA_ORIENTATION=+
MKFFGVAILLASALAGASAADDEATVGDRTITQVVKLLQELLDKSKAEGDTERDLYAKYKCYCDTNEAEKKAEIQHLSEEIALLESQIEELQGSSARLSKEVAKLDADMKANEADRDEAVSIRNTEHTDYIALKKDLEDAIEQMREAIKVLAAIGADQTLQAAADHTQYMGKPIEEGLLKLKATVKSALVAAGAFVSKKQASAMDAFLQAPFTGTYTAQSGEVVGILRDMRDTFSANLQAANEKEERQQKAYDKYMDEMSKAYEAMQDSYSKKQDELSGNDDSLSSKKEQLDTAQGAKAEAEDFLAKLLDMCAAKKKQFNERVALRTNEEAALAEAISILNSDAAFATFGAVDATKTGPTALVQLRLASVREHRPLSVARAAAPTGDRRIAAREFLQKAAREQGGSSASMFSRLAAMLQANNPFAVVLEEIAKMLDLLDKEGEQDKKHNDWCVDETKKTSDDITTKANEIIRLTSDIDVLDAEINDPETGLKATIKSYEDTLQANYESQQTETKDRREENIAYQKDISNLVEAEKLLERAIVVLRKYYAKISAEIKAEMSLVQSRKARNANRDDPAPPATWEDKYKGQSEAGGTDAISMLEFILTNTKKEETQAHSDEQDAQHAYEDSMQNLKDEEKSTQKALADARDLLAQKELSLSQRQEERTKTEKEKKALDDYLEKITPGCNFIKENLDLRNTNRENERTALNDAVSLIEGTPAYQEAMAVAHNETLGECKEICALNENVVACKACLADVTIPAFAQAIPPHRVAERHWPAPLATARLQVDTVSASE